MGVAYSKSTEPFQTTPTLIKLADNLSTHLNISNDVSDQCRKCLMRATQSITPALANKEGVWNRHNCDWTDVFVVNGRLRLLLLREESIIPMHMLQIID